MASLKQMRGKYYSRIRQWDGSKQIERIIPLKTSKKTDARVRNSEVERYENDIKSGMEFEFAWMKENGGKTEIKPLSLSDAIDAFINYRIKTNTCRESTISMNRRALNLFVKVVKNVTVSSITLEHIDRFIKYSTKLNHSKHTINIGLRTIRTFMIWLYDRDLVSRKIKIKSLSTDENDPKYITEVEFNRLMELDFGHLRFKRMFKLSWETGLRLSEPFIGVVNGNWIDIPADKSKNHKERSIRLNQEQVDTISILQEHSQNNPTMDSIKWYSKKFKKGLLKIGILDKHFHCLRHSFGARRIIETNGNIHLVRDEMGHSSVTVTERYTKLNRKRLLDDFPSLKEEVELSQNVLKYGIRDTLIRDTVPHYQTINREELN